MNAEEKVSLITAILTKHKAADIVTLDVHHLTSLLHYLIICTGTSTRHIRALANHLARFSTTIDEKTKSHDDPETGWMLIDLGDCVVHLMTEEMRTFYALEKLWHVEDSLTE
jgi:ribosome-associated protein